MQKAKKGIARESMSSQESCRSSLGRMKNSFRVFQSILLLCFVSLLQACIAPVEVVRVTSPDGTLDAVVIESDGGATTSFGYSLNVVVRGKKASSGVKVAALYGAVRNEQAYGVNAKWENPTTLAFEYLKSQEVRAINGTVSWNYYLSTHVTAVNIANRKVTILIRPGILDPSAPRGGMAYNLTK